MHVAEQNCLSLRNALLIPRGSLSMVSRTINFLFIVGLITSFMLKLYLNGYVF